MDDTLYETPVPATLPRVGRFVCRHGVPRVLSHDCDYTDAREALIPYAEQMATADTAGMASWPEDERQLHWDRRFHFHMDALIAASRALFRRRP